MTVTSAQRKLSRGIEHVNAISGEAKAFQDSNAYKLRVEREVRSPEEIHCECFAVEKNSPPDHWPLLLGEAIQNLRSSLDHVIWANKGRQFPIFTDPCEYQVKGRPMIARTPQAIRTVVHDAQPFQTTQRAAWYEPRWDPLAVLNRFSNRDKHRELVAVASFVDLPWVSYDDANIEFTFSGEGRPLHDGTHVTSFTLRGPQADKMQVHPDFNFEVHAEGVPLINTLEGIVWRVAQVVEACEAGLSLPLWLRPLGHDDPPASPSKR